MNNINSINDALQIFHAGPSTPGWDNAACYLLDEQTPPEIRDQVETSITDAMKAIYGLTFQPDARTEAGEPVMTTRSLSSKLSIGEQQLVSWVQWLEERYGNGKPILRRPRGLNRLQ